MMVLISGLLACGLNKINKTDDSAYLSDSQGFYLGDMLISPSEINFQTTQIGQEELADVILTNTGDATLTVSSFYLDGDTEFSLMTTALSFDVEPGEDSIQQVAFSPVEEIDYNGSLNIWLSSESSTAQMEILGSGSIDEVVDTGEDTGGNTIDNGLSLDSTSHNFGTVGLGTTSITTINVINDGTSDILIQSISSSDSAFAYTSSSDVLPGTLIGADSSRALDLSFNPSQEAAYSASITLATDSTVTPSLSLSLSGTGEEQCFICAPDIDVISNGSAPDTFDVFAVSNFSNPDTQEFYVQNVGDEPLTITNILLRNDNSPSSQILCGVSGTYTLVGNYTNRTVAPYDSVTVQVQLQYNTSNGTTICGEQSFYPINEENTIEILSDDPDEGSVFIKLGGTITYL
jgi:hypothetical protein